VHVDNGTLLLRGLAIGASAGARGRAAAEAGGGCEVTVADDGRGMSFEAARRAFDPFYSGREAGRGAGLGLSKAWRLVEASGGTVLLESRPGHGTRVSVVLPEVAATQSQAQASSQSAEA
jgi:signal transduction histidine kinase